MGKPKEKLEWYKRYPADWVADTRLLTLEERGAWADIIEYLELYSDLHDTYGQLTHTAAEWGSLLGVTPDKAASILSSLGQKRIADVTECNGLVTVSCRRMQKKAQEREQTRLRVQRHRAHQAKPTTEESPRNDFVTDDVTGDVTGDVTRDTRAREKLEAREEESRIKNLRDRNVSTEETASSQSATPPPGERGVGVKRATNAETHKGPDPDRHRKEQRYQREKHQRQLDEAGLGNVDHSPPTKTLPEALFQMGMRQLAQAIAHCEITQNNGSVVIAPDSLSAEKMVAQGLSGVLPGVQQVFLSRYPKAERWVIQDQSGGLREVLL